MMLHEGMTRLAIRSLTSSLEDEKEFAVKLLLEFSHVEGYCAKLASEKGAVVLLSSMAGDPERPVLSNIAEDLLKNMEKMEENIQPLAAAGRFQPVLTRLCEGKITRRRPPPLSGFCNCSMDENGRLSRKPGNFPQKTGGSMFLLGAAFESNSQAQKMSRSRWRPFWEG